MLNKVAGKLAKKLVKYSDADKEEIYIYGVELIISTFFCLFSILLVSCLLSSFTSGLVFISVFVPLRLFTGGYHAETYSKCFVISNLSYLLVLFLKCITWKIVPMEIWWCLLAGMCWYILKNAPIINPAQPINESKQKRSKKNSKIYFNSRYCVDSFFGFKPKRIDDYGNIKYLPGFSYDADFRN